MTAAVPPRMRRFDRALHQPRQLGYSSAQAQQHWRLIAGHLAHAASCAAGRLRRPAEGEHARGGSARRSSGMQRLMIAAFCVAPGPCLPAFSIGEWSKLRRISRAAAGTRSRSPCSSGSVASAAACCLPQGGLAPGIHPAPGIHRVLTSLPCATQVLASLWRGSSLADRSGLQRTHPPYG